MMIHLAVIHAALPWVYIIILGMQIHSVQQALVHTNPTLLAVTGVIGIFGLLASLSVSHLAI